MLNCLQHAGVGIGSAGVGIGFAGVGIVLAGVGIGFVANPPAFLALTLASTQPD